MGEGGLIPMRVDRVLLDSRTQNPVVILLDETGKRALPIWIGLAEASAIATALEGIRPPRPMTHDLFASVLEAAGARLERVVVTEIRENTYFARLHLRLGGEVREIDSRPSDAIALAVRTSAPIFVAPEVVEGAAAVVAPAGSDSEDAYKDLLEHLDPEMISKYKM